ncbi:MAG: metallophosphoesterase [Bacteroidetes bacterium]|nr:metallophosphoesterase [Bacteroidota bacterium]
MMFRLTAILIVLLLQLFLYLRLRSYIIEKRTLPRSAGPVALGLFLFFNIPVPVVMSYFWSLTHLPAWVMTVLMPLFIWHIATFFIALALGSLLLLRLPFVLALRTAMLHPTIRTQVTTMKETPNFQRFDASRRSFLEKGVIGLSAYSFVGATAGAVSSGEFEITRRTIIIPGLPEQFKGFTIGMMSDIHSSIFMNREDMSAYVKEMNGLKTDMIVVTGDFVNSKTEEVYPFAEAFSELQAAHGVYGCLGNHDFFTKNVDMVAKKIDECGVKLLRNDAVKIVKGDSYFNLLGVDDIGRNMQPDEYFAKALAFAKNDQPKILLCHKPYYFQHAKDLGIALTLSGHTHGGQIVFGTVERTPISLAALASKYVSGHYMLGDSNLYVNNGIGYTGIPVRVNCPAELTVLTLA